MCATSASVSYAARSSVRSSITLTASVAPVSSRSAVAFVRNQRASPVSRTVLSVSIGSGCSPRITRAPGSSSA